MNLSFKKILFLVGIGVVLLIAIVILTKPKINNSPQANETKNSQASSISIDQNDKPQVISTKPDPLEETIISATDTVEITFNRPLENVGEFKSRLEPNLEYKVELSPDRKTAKIKPVKGFLLGTTYTLFIGTETKFDGVGRWGEEKIFHFKTITYRGV